MPSFFGGEIIMEHTERLHWMDDRLGLIDTISDEAFVMDDFGNAVWVPFSLPGWYFQSH